MADNNFVSNDNKALLWEMMLTNNMFDGIPSENFKNVQIMFENVILRLSHTIKGDISTNELLSLNKSAILEIKTNLDIFKKKNNQDTFNTEKVLVFDKNLESAKNNFSETIAVKKPEKPEFTLKTDEPIASNNMNELLEKLQRERESLLPPPPENPHTNLNENNNRIEKSDDITLIIENTEINKPLKKVSNIEELFNNSNEEGNQNISKKVSFTKNAIYEDNINRDNLLTEEYKGVEKINDNLKLNSIFNLLKEIDKKQDEIIKILKS